MLGYINAYGNEQTGKQIFKKVSLYIQCNFYAGFEYEIRNVLSPHSLRIIILDIVLLSPNLGSSEQKKDKYC